MYMQADDEKLQLKLDMMREFWAEWVYDTPDESMNYLDRCKRIANIKRLKREKEERDKCAEQQCEFKSSDVSYNELRDKARALIYDYARLKYICILFEIYFYFILFLFVR